MDWGFPWSPKLAGWFHTYGNPNLSWLVNGRSQFRKWMIKWAAPMTWEDDGFVNAMTRDHRPVGEDMIKQKNT